MNYFVLFFAEGKVINEMGTFLDFTVHPHIGGRIYYHDDAWKIRMVEYVFNSDQALTDIYVEAELDRRD